MIDWLYLEHLNATLINLHCSNTLMPFLRFHQHESFSIASRWNFWLIDNTFPKISLRFNLIWLIDWLYLEQFNTKLKNPFTPFLRSLFTRFTLETFHKISLKTLFFILKPGSWMLQWWIWFYIYWESMLHFPWLSTIHDPLSIRFLSIYLLPFCYICLSYVRYGSVQLVVNRMMDLPW